MLLMAACVALMPARARAQTPPPDVPPPPPVLGRDARELAQTIGKNYLLSVWLTNVGGENVTQTAYARVAPDGNITLPVIGAVKAEGVALSALEASVTAAYKASNPKASAWVTILDKTPLPPPPPPPAPKPAPAPAPKPAPAPAPAAAPAPTPAPAPAPAAAPAPPTPQAATQAAPATKPAPAPTPAPPAPTSAPAPAAK
jgi:hypothetical protein